MALPHTITVLLLVLALVRIELSMCQVIKAKVSCIDCKSNADLSGIKVLVKCDKVKKLAMATTEDDGSFEAEVPSDYKTPPTVPLNCLAKLLGGPNQLYASNKIMVSQIVKTHDSNTYTISNPLSFYQSCLSTINQAKCEANNNWASSKTVDLPLPPQWGLAPSSYYIPFFPIIGIP
ncbi:Pollen Ole e 1 allergen and extensin family protein [Parasponia andersonii]|uniref:Pollen Ole e 1 allergen and extensin family protein n=1 Tax=Parasponia andersonii TaxID=3476 RepID=A0A2P5CWI9_PARAD|nr:Pollen Ole e 1 allergen and extensin family protein [Parasponia andersonii]